ncbi:MAG: hypothetical protein ACREBG_20515 [Pyrinomonadaceae bacterium]
MVRSLASILSGLLLLLSCQNHTSQPKAVTKGDTPTVSTPSGDSVLIENIKIFSEDTGEEGQKALSYMIARPRNELIRDMLKLRDSVRSEILLNAFCSEVGATSQDTVLIVKGSHRVEQILRQVLSAQRGFVAAVAFRL